MLESLFANIWNRCVTPKRKPVPGGLNVGLALAENQSSYLVSIPQRKRTEHIAIGGKTGQGKSFLVRNFVRQDMETSRGFLVIDFHGDLAPYILAFAAAREHTTGQDLSQRLVVVDPADPTYSVGFNLFENVGGNTFLQVGEFTQILKKRWQLETFGARTEELLRNSLQVLTETGHTLLELPALLTHPGFREACLARCRNADTLDYFRQRFQTASEAMQAVMREPILNKVTAFTSDPQFRHMLGQQHSTISFAQLMDSGAWVVLQLNKGRLGENAVTLAALMVAKLKNALFSRQRRTLFSWYLDEVQNLVAADTGLEMVLSEARKFGISVVFANQFLAQFPPVMQAAALAVGTHIYFQLSSMDADKVAGALDGGKRLGALLKNLPQRHVVVKSGSEPLVEAQVPSVAEIRTDSSDLERRVRHRWSTPRIQVEQAIRQRLAPFQTERAAAQTREDLHDWD